MRYVVLKGRSPRSKQSALISWWSFHAYIYTLIYVLSFMHTCMCCLGLHFSAVVHEICFFEGAVASFKTICNNIRMELPCIPLYIDICLVIYVYMHVLFRVALFCSCSWICCFEGAVASFKTICHNILMELPCIHLYIDMCIVIHVYMHVLFRVALFSSCSWDMLFWRGGCLVQNNL